MPFALRRKIRGEGSFIIALFFSVQPKHTHPTAEKDIWPEKKTLEVESEDRESF